MYYAVLRKEVKMPCSGGELTLRVGGVYEIKDRYDEVYGFTTILYRSVDTMGMDEDTNFGDSYGPWYEMPLKQAREYFTEPFNELDTVMEESFLVCEAAYC